MFRILSSQNAAATISRYSVHTARQLPFWHFQFFNREIDSYFQLLFRSLREGDQIIHSLRKKRRLRSNIYTPSSPFPPRLVPSYAHNSPSGTEPAARSTPTEVTSRTSGAVESAKAPRGKKHIQLQEHPEYIPKQNVRRPRTPPSSCLARGRSRGRPCGRERGATREPRFYRVPRRSLNYTGDRYNILFPVPCSVPVISSSGRCVIRRARQQLMKTKSVNKPRASATFLIGLCNPFSHRLLRTYKPTQALVGTEQAIHQDHNANYKHD